MNKNLKFLVLILMLVFITACGISKDKMEKQIKTGIQEMFDKQYSNYGLKVSKVEITGEDTYKGIVEFLYNGKAIIQPVIINKNDKNYSYEFKFNPYVLKEEAEKETLKLIKNSLSKEEYKKYNIEVSKVNLFENGKNSYEGLAILKMKNKEYNVKVDVKYSDEGTIMYKIEEKEFSKLNYDLMYKNFNIPIQIENKVTINLELYKSINNYSESLASFKTQKFNIRVDKLEDGSLRYASCSANSSFENRPDTILNNGSTYENGVKGDVYYEFVTGEYTYRVYSFVMGDVKNKLEVIKDNKIILSENSL